MMPSNTESARLSRTMAELHEQRRIRLLQLKALRNGQEHAPLSAIPALSSALRVLKRLYSLPQIQLAQQEIDQLALEEAEAQSNAINIIAIGIRAALSEQADHVNSLEQNQIGFGTRIEQIGAALTQLQESNAGLGTHLNLINSAVADLQQQHAGLSAYTSEIG